MPLESGSRGGKKRFARWSFMLAASGAIVFGVGMSTARESYQGWKVDQEINTLKARAEALEGRKNELTNVIQKLQSPDAIDRESRAQLGLRKPGERVIVLRSEGESPSWDSTLDAAYTPPEEPKRTNPQKWFRYFFAH